ncbi:MAG: hypothetical protein JRD84_01010 [Deltaproteobacteria bacterium]|nr:hypothetical protein [Deltaproteobacteria bacterium]
MGNQIRTTILLAVMTALIIWVGQLLGGRQGMLIALIFAAGMNFFSYWYSDKLVLSLFSTHPPPGGANCAVARCTTACDGKSRAGRG